MKPVCSGFIYFCNRIIHCMTKLNNKAQLFGSYMNTFIIETITSKHNPELEVVLVNGRYQLNAGNVNYSFGPLHDAFRRYFHLDIPQLLDGSKVLILGFGAGSVAYILREEYGFQGMITGVEWDEQIIYLAKKHFYLEKLPHIEIINTDAWDFLEQNTKAYDLIIVDLYYEDTVPEKFERQEFIQWLYNALTINGKIVFNKLQGDDGASVWDLFAKFRKICGQSELIKIFVNKETPNCFIISKKLHCQPLVTDINTNKEFNYINDERNGKK